MEGGLIFILGANNTYCSGIQDNKLHSLMKC